MHGHSLTTSQYSPSRNIWRFYQTSHLNQPRHLRFLHCFYSISVSRKVPAGKSTRRNTKLTAKTVINLCISIPSQTCSLRQRILDVALTLWRWKWFWMRKCGPLLRGRRLRLHRMSAGRYMQFTVYFRFNPWNSNETSHIFAVTKQAYIAARRLDVNPFPGATTEPLLFSFFIS